MVVQPPAQALVSHHPASRHRGEKASTNQAEAVWHHHDRAWDATAFLCRDEAACLDQETTIPVVVMDPETVMDPVTVMERGMGAKQASDW